VPKPEKRGLRSKNRNTQVTRDITDERQPDLVAFYEIRSGNEADPFFNILTE